MREDVRERVISMLSDYSEDVRKIAQLRYEIEHLPKISENETIEAMTFKKNDREGDTHRDRSDKVFYIAASYQNAVRQEKCDLLREYYDILAALEQKVGRLRYYVSLLDSKQAEVIRLYYFEKRSWDMISENMSLTPKPLRRLRNAGIDRLTEMYEFSKQAP